MIMPDMDFVARTVVKEKENKLTATPPVRRIASKTLLGPEGKVIIDHDGQEYLLRKTQAGKLLLTK